MVNRVKSKFINDFAKTLVKEDLVTPKSIKGCNNREIEKIEKRYNVKLPRLYKDFLLSMGKSTTNYNWKRDEHGFWFLRDYDLLYPNPLWMTKCSRMYFEMDKFDLLPSQNYFTFCFGASEFYFFSTNKGDDPPVHYYLEKNAYDYRQKHIKTFEESWKDPDYKRRYLYTLNGSEMFSSFTEFLTYQLENHLKNKI